MSANGKKWSQYDEATAIADEDKVLVRDVSEAAGSQIKEMTKVNLSDTLGLSGHLQDSDLHTTRADIDHQTGTKKPSSAVSLDGDNDKLVGADSDFHSFNDAGTSDKPFSVEWSGYVRDLANFAYLAEKASAAGSAEWILFFSNNSKLQLSLRDVSAGVYTTRIQDTASVSDDDYVHVVCTYSGVGGASAGDGVKLYIDKKVVASTANNDPAYVAMENLAGALNVGWDQINTRYSKTEHHRLRVYNFELSASEIEELFEGGKLPAAWEWGGTLGNLWTADFSSDSVDGVTANDGSVSAAETVGADSDNIQFTANSGSSGSRFLQKASLFNKGRKYLLSGFEYFVPSGQSNIDGLRFTANTQTIEQLDSPTLGSWQTLPDTVFTADEDSDLRIRAQDGGSLTFDDTGGDDTFAIRAGKVTDLGCVGDWDFSAADEVNGVVPDRGPGGVNLSITGGQVQGQTRALHIDAKAPAADEKLLTISVNGSEKASIDEDGDAVVQKLNIANIPTSSAGLSSGDVWNDSGTLKIVT